MKETWNKGVDAAQMVMDIEHEMEAAQTTQTPAYTIASCGASGMQSLPAGDYGLMPIAAVDRF